MPSGLADFPRSQLVRDPAGAPQEHVPRATSARLPSFRASHSAMQRIQRNCLVVSLAAFEATHSNWIFDSLAWRDIDDPDERGLTQN